ncbi:UDP-N-acetylmuramoyl-L-alanine--D-glutamate ligase [Arcobacter sp. FWKO B]|uniref:UDP-N-acetylmuramoyl-L-alanine--D-glutamate ligase n=1 Tax=Arcobacter sp. FWKO B TaxID=2593672 RepID=UPI0018A54579|nr:UDP-N-acetylmuramoyl-L-alanine--D-glutamate ligase [Arcobacter sp. FWKO B]QOG11653.1 UDP-N-acetylmuramoyl-L-alanine--D-glutamate ligase [Arcobacter sp. FWKO B]
MRILGRGITASAIFEKYPNAKVYDDTNISEFDENSDEITVVSPGIPPYHTLVKKTKNIVSEYDFLIEKDRFSIWISGTNGKTTTTAMCEHLLKSFGGVAGGNIGVPLAKLPKDANIWVLETSSFTLHYTNSAKPNIYLLLPITDDHVSWHGSFEEYEKSKLKPLDFLYEGEVAIIPKKYENYPTNGFKITYENSYDLAQKLGLDISKINFKEPFLLDAIMALSTTKVLFDKADYELINSFKIDAHKVEEFYDKQQRLWVDDSKATNLDATIWAMTNYKDKKVHLILGGDDKGANLVPLFKDLKNYDVVIYAIGSNAQKLEMLSKEFGIDVVICNIIDNAVKEISLRLDKNGVAMLSPAAASLDQFKSYKHRGETFKELVASL